MKTVPMDLYASDVCLSVLGIKAGLRLKNYYFTWMALLSKVDSGFFLPVRSCDNVQKSSTKQEELFVLTLNIAI